jgi:hypothetical protein
MWSDTQQITQNMKQGYIYKERGYIELCFINALAYTLLIFCGGCNETNTAPEMLPLEEQQWLVNSTGSLEIFGRDIEGGVLNFEFMMDPLPPTLTEGALGSPTLTPLAQNQALFQWAPSIRDIGVYIVTFTITDSGGLSDEESIRLEVYSPGIGDQAALRFIEPVGAGQNFSLNQNSCLELGVQVNADGLAASDILIDLVAPLIEGARFVPEGELTGKDRHLSWCPSTDQVNQADRYTFTFRARRRREDTWSEGIKKRYLVRLEQGNSDLDREGCIGRPPSLQHDPPMEVSGVLDYNIEIIVNDDLGIKSPPLLTLWTQNSPPPEVLSDPAWSLIEFERSSDEEGAWRARIPNLNLDVNQSQTVYYGILVTDNDDPNGARCDHTIESNIYALRVSGGGPLGQLMLCQPCSSHDQCGEVTDLCLAYEEGGFCGRACNTQRPCDSGFDCLSLETSEGSQTQQCVPESLSCLSTCQPDEFDQNGQELRSYQDVPTLTFGTYTNLALCGERYDLYQVEIPAEGGLDIEVTFDATQIDIDLAVALGSSLDANGELSFNYESASPNQSTERISIPCVQASGDPEIAWVAVVPYEQSMRGPYQLNLRETRGACNQTCEDDVNEPLEPVALSDGLYEGLKLCPQDSDQFIIEVEPGWVVSAYAQFNLSYGDLDMVLYSEAGLTIQSDIGARQDALIEWRSDSGGRFLLEVSGANPMVENTYSLDLYLYPTTACDSTMACPIDTFCYPQLGCLDDTCNPALSCGAYHRCVYPVSESAQESVGHCASDCFTDGMCRVGEVCKLFESGEGICQASGTTSTGLVCSEHSDCEGGAICTRIEQQYMCLNAGCEYANCPMDSVCVYELNGSYCLPDCDMGCPNGWSCSNQEGMRACRPN